MFFKNVDLKAKDWQQNQSLLNEIIAKTHSIQLYKLISMNYIGKKS